MMEMYLVYVIIQSIPLFILVFYTAYLLEKLREKNEIINILKNHGKKKKNTSNL